MGPRVVLDAMVKRKIPSPCWDSKPCNLDRSLVTILTELPWPLICVIIETYKIKQLIYFRGSVNNL
jgi:hypothetical protein